MVSSSASSVHASDVARLRFEQDPFDPSAPVGVRVMLEYEVGTEYPAHLDGVSFGVAVAEDLAVLEIAAGAALPANAEIKKAESVRGATFCVVDLKSKAPILGAGTHEIAVLDIAWAEGTSWLHTIAFAGTEPAPGFEQSTPPIAWGGEKKIQMSAVDGYVVTTTDPIGAALAGSPEGGGTGIAESGEGGGEGGGGPPGSDTPCSTIDLGLTNPLPSPDVIVDASGPYSPPATVQTISQGLTEALGLQTANALIDASIGAVIMVKDGTYTETLSINVSDWDNGLTLYAGGGPTTTIIRSPGTAMVPVIAISASTVTSTRIRIGLATARNVGLEPPHPSYPGLFGFTIKDAVTESGVVVSLASSGGAGSTGVDVALTGNVITRSPRIDSVPRGRRTVEMGRFRRRRSRHRLPAAPSCLARSWSRERRKNSGRRAHRRPRCRSDRSCSHEASCSRALASLALDALPIPPSLGCLGYR